MDTDDRRYKIQRRALWNIMERCTIVPYVTVIEDGIVRLVYDVTINRVTEGEWGVISHALCEEIQREIVTREKKRSRKKGSTSRAEGVK